MNTALNRSRAGRRHKKTASDEAVVRGDFRHLSINCCQTLPPANRYKKVNLRYYLFILYHFYSYENKEHP